MTALTLWASICTPSALVKFTLVRLEVKLVFQEPLQNLTDMLDVLRNRLGEDQDVQINEDKYVEHVS